MSVKAKGAFCYYVEVVTPQKEVHYHQLTDEEKELFSPEWSVIKRKKVICWISLRIVDDWTLCLPTYHPWGLDKTK